MYVCMYVCTYVCIMGGSRCSPGGSNEPPELGPKKLFIIFFKFDAPKIKFEPP